MSNESDYEKRQKIIMDRMDSPSNSAEDILFLTIAARLNEVSSNIFARSLSSSIIEVRKKGFLG